ncbi:MAG: DUF6427 family protein [Bacteroidota bacterium]|nr:DUF6427 family protein [Bacteroidota bacterium]MDP4204666.1 DUF6427 family protein [Bacteroidota bacterium]
MLLRLFRSGHVFQLILIPLVGILLWTKALLSPDSYPFFAGEDAMPLFAPVFNYLHQSVFLSKLITLILFLSIIIYILRINYKYGFIKEHTHLPGILFILITAGFDKLFNFHPVYFAALLLLISFEQMFDSYTNSSLSKAFNSSFFLAIASLFYFPVIFLFPVIIIGFFTLQKTIGWRNYVLTLLGVALPWIYCFAAYFSTQRFQYLIDTISQNIHTSNIVIFKDLHIQIFLGYLIFLTILSSFVIISHYEEKRISSRKYFKVFFLLFVCSVALLVILPSVSREMAVIFAIPLSYLIANYFLCIRHPLWGELLFTILIGLVVFLQLT